MLFLVSVFVLCFFLYPTVYSYILMYCTVQYLTTCLKSENEPVTSGSTCKPLSYAPLYVIMYQPDPNYSLIKLKQFRVQCCASESGRIRTHLSGSGQKEPNPNETLQSNNRLENQRYANFHQKTSKIPKKLSRNELSK